MQRRPDSEGFCCCRSQDRDWLLLLGSGIDGEGGALLLYCSKQLSSGELLFIDFFASWQRTLQAC